MAELIPQKGYYRHFKGNYYQLTDIAYHSETLEPMVVYRALYGERKLWVRPASMWFEQIDRENYHGPRFVAVCEEAQGDSNLENHPELVPVVDWALQHTQSAEVHRIWHWRMVAANAILLHAKALIDQTYNRDVELPNQKVMLYFAYLHDSCRLNDGEDLEHGPRAAKAIEEIRDSLLHDLTDEEFAKLQKTIELHTAVQSTGDITIDCCFDSDRLDLGRVGITPDPARMATKYGAEICHK